MASEFLIHHARVTFHSDYFRGNTIIVWHSLRKVLGGAVMTLETKPLSGNEFDVIEVCSIHRQPSGYSDTAGDLYPNNPYLSLILFQHNAKLPLIYRGFHLALQLLNIYCRWQLGRDTSQLCWVGTHKVDNSLPAIPSHSKSLINLCTASNSASELCTEPLATPSTYFANSSCILTRLFSPSFPFDELISQAVHSQLNPYPLINRSCLTSLAAPNSCK